MESSIKKIKSLEFLILSNATPEAFISACNDIPETILEGRYVYLLHFAVKKDAHRDIIKHIVDTIPSACLKRWYGNLPIHYACRYKASIDIFRILLDAAPETIHETSREWIPVIGKYEELSPIFLAIRNDVPVEALKYLISLSPSTLVASDSRRYTPFHLAIKPDTSLELIRYMNDLSSNGLNTEDELGRLPIHHAVINKVSLDMLQLLVDLAPDTVKLTDSAGNLPLHLATDPSHVKYLIYCFPESVNIENKRKNTQLHYACMHDGSRRSLLKILVANPESIDKKNDEGNLPLHLACREAIPTSIIKTLINEAPHTLNIVNYQLHLPLHRAIINKSPLDVIQLLVFLSSAIIRIPDSYGMSTLHMCCEHSNDINVYQTILKAAPELINVKNRKDWLPIHVAMTNQISKEILTLLIKANPETLRARNNYDRLPIHEALSSEKASSEMVDYLIELAPETLTEPDRYGNLPVHLAVNVSKHSLDTIKKLLTLNPDSISCKNNDGRLPIHEACDRRDISMDVVRYLLSIDPNGIMEKDAYGRLPLHLAIKNGASIDIISEFISLAPESIRTKTERGDLPLHYAYTIETIELLLLLYPESISEKNNDGDLLLHLASKLPLSNDIVLHLISLDHQTTLVKNGNNELPIHLAIRSKNYDNIMLLILTSPLTCLEKNREGYIPLHMSILNGSPIEIINALIIQSPESAKEKCVKGGYAIHLAIKNNCPVSIIRSIMNQAPFTCTKKDDEGNNIIHLAIQYNLPYDLIKDLMVYANGNCMTDKNMSNQTPLHLAIQYNSPSNVIMELIKSTPNATVMRYSYGDSIIHLLLRHLPDEELFQQFLSSPIITDLLKIVNDNNETCLHIALECNLPTNMILQLIDLNPDATKIKNKTFYQLPIHIASKRKTIDNRVITALLTHNRKIRVKDIEGNYPLYIALKNQLPTDIIRSLLRLTISIGLPPLDLTIDMEENELHLAVINQCSVSIIEDILKINPSSNRPNKDGNLPIHLSIIHHSSYEVIKCLIHSKPVSLIYKNKYDRIPLMLAMEHSNPSISLETIQYIIDKKPDCCLIRTNPDEENIALHLALKYDVNLDIIQLLLKAYPKSYLKRNKLNQTPFDIGLQCNCNHLTLEYMTRLDLPYDYHGKSKDHGYSWTSYLDPVKNKHTSLILIQNFIRDLFLSYELQVCKLLAYYKDELGREAINITYKSIRDIFYDQLFFCGRFKINEGCPLHQSIGSVVVLADDYGIIDEYHRVFIDSAKYSPENGLTIDEFKSAIQYINQLWNRSMIDETILEQDFEFRDSMNTETFVSPVLISEPSSPSRGALSKSTSLSDINSLNEMSVIDSQLKGTFYMNWETFEKYCKLKYGEYKSIVLKFMRDRDQYLHEKHIRSYYQLDENYIIGLYPDPPKERYQYDIQTLIINKNVSLREYSYCLAMPAADRSLDTVYRCEDISFDIILKDTENILTALIHFYNKSLIYGDLKLLNIVRMNDSIRLINLESVTKMIKSSNEQKQDDQESWRYMGCKFSSGILPPEMFHEISNELELKAYEMYWQNSILYINSNGGQSYEWNRMWNRIKPFYVNDRMYVIKCFDLVNDCSNQYRISNVITDSLDYSIDDQSGSGYSDRQTIRNQSDLPYELLRADDLCRFDSWSYGLILYQMIAGKPFIAVDKNDDFDREAAINNFEILKSSKSKQLIYEKIHNAIRLTTGVPQWFEVFLMVLLDPNPSTRWSLLQAQEFLNQRKALNVHHDLVEYYQEYSVAVARMDNQIASIIEKDIQSVGQRNPSSAIYKQFNIKQSSQRLEIQRKSILKKSIMIPGSFSDLPWKRKSNDSLFSMIPTRIIIANYSLASSESSLVDQSRKDAYVTIFSKLYEWFSRNDYSIDTEIPSDAQEVLKEYKKCFQGCSMLIYLVDDITLEPIVKNPSDPIYPIEILPDEGAENIIDYLLPFMIETIDVIGYRKAISVLAAGTTIEDVMSSDDKTTAKVSSIVYDKCLGVLNDIYLHYDRKCHFDGLLPVVMDSNVVYWTMEESLTTRLSDPNTKQSINVSNYDKLKQSIIFDDNKVSIEVLIDLGPKAITNEIKKQEKTLFEDNDTTILDSNVSTHSDRIRDISLFATGAEYSTTSKDDSSPRSDASSVVHVASNYIDSELLRSKGIPSVLEHSVDIAPDMNSRGDVSLNSSLTLSEVLPTHTGYVAELMITDEFPILTEDDPIAMLSVNVAMNDVSIESNSIQIVENEVVSSDQSACVDEIPTTTDLHVSADNSFIEEKTTEIEYGIVIEDVPNDASSIVSDDSVVINKNLFGGDDVVIDTTTVVADEFSGMAVDDPFLTDDDGDEALGVKAENILLENIQHSNETLADDNPFANTIRSEDSDSSQEDKNSFTYSKMTMNQSAAFTDATTIDDEWTIKDLVRDSYEEYSELSTIGSPSVEASYNDLFDSVGVKKVDVQSIEPVVLTVNEPPLITGYIKKVLHSLFVRDKVYYFILEKGCLSYYDQQSSAESMFSVNQIWDQFFDQSTGSFPNLKDKRIELDKLTLKMLTNDVLELELFFDNYDERDKWADGMRQHIQYARTYL